MLINSLSVIMWTKLFLWNHLQRVAWDDSIYKTIHRNASRFREVEWQTFILRGRLTEIRLALVLLSSMTRLHLTLFSWNRATELRLTLLSRNRATELRLTLFSRVRLSETHFVISEVSDLSDAAWNARQGIKPGSKLPRDPETSRGVLQGLNKASAFWPYQSL